MTDSFIPYGHQSIDEADIAAVNAVLRSDFLTQGPAVPGFEQAVADYCGARHAIAVSNGTAALHLACLALDVGPGDVVWTSPITFVASANCARYCGAEVDFVDIDPQTQNISLPQLEAKLAAAQIAKRLPKVVIPVHFSGRPCDMEGIAQLARRYGFRIIEDASHALGASYGPHRVGNGLHADVTVFSFHPVKIITTGEGGMLLTADAGLAERLTRLRSHGITRDPAAMQGPSEGGWYYQQIELGFNYRMTDLQAALGLSQMTRLEKFIARRNLLAERYRLGLAELPLTLPPVFNHGISAWHLYTVRLPGDGETRQRVYDRMKAAGIGVNVHYIPVHLQPYYRALGFGDGDFPVAENYYRHALTLPLYYDLAEAAQARVMRTLAAALAGEGPTKEKPR